MGFESEHVAGIDQYAAHGDRYKDGQERAYGSLALSATGDHLGGAPLQPAATAKLSA